MNAVALWASIVVIGAITFTYRWSFVFLFERLAIPDWLRNALRFVPIAALTAIILPELLIARGALNTDLLNTRLLAGLIAAAVAWRTRNVLLTIVIGMASLWALEWLTRFVR
jgi:branched-subunit amino acid transport protein